MAFREDRTLGHEAGAAWPVAPAWRATARLPERRGALDFRPGRPGPCPEVDCLRAHLPRQTIAMAEQRAAELGTGADRVLIADGWIGEDHYLAALASWLGIAHVTTLDDVPREACPFGGIRLIEAAEVGLLPLNFGGGLAWVVAPRNLAARTLAKLMSRSPGLARRIRLTSTAELNRFVARHGSDALATQATNALLTRWPQLSAAPRRWRPPVALAAMATAFLGALYAFPGETRTAVEAGLASGIPRLAAAAAGRLVPDPADRPAGPHPRQEIAGLHHHHRTLPRGCGRRGPGDGAARARLPAREAGHQIRHGSRRPGDRNCAGASRSGRTIRDRHGARERAAHQAEGAQCSAGVCARHVHCRLRCRRPAGTRSAPARARCLPQRRRRPGLRAGKPHHRQHRRQLAHAPVHGRICRAVRPVPPRSRRARTAASAWRIVESFPHRRVAQGRRLGSLQCHRGRRSRRPARALRLSFDHRALDHLRGGAGAFRAVAAPTHALVQRLGSNLGSAHALALPAFRRSRVRRVCVISACGRRQRAGLAHPSTRTRRVSSTPMPPGCRFSAPMASSSPRWRGSTASRSAPATALRSFSASAGSSGADFCRSPGGWCSCRCTGCCCRSQPGVHSFSFCAIRSAGKRPSTGSPALRAVPDARASPRSTPCSGTTIAAASSIARRPSNKSAKLQSFIRVARCGGTPNVVKPRVGCL